MWNSILVQMIHFDSFWMMFTKWHEFSPLRHIATKLGSQYDTLNTSQGSISNYFHNQHNSTRNGSGETWTPLSSRERAYHRHRPLQKSPQRPPPFGSEFIGHWFVYGTLQSAPSSNTASRWRSTWFHAPARCGSRVVELLYNYPRWY